MAVSFGAELKEFEADFDRVRASVEALRDVFFILN